MRPFFLLLGAAVSLMADSSLRGSVSLQSQHYLERPEGTYAQNQTLIEKVEWRYQEAAWNTRLSLYAQQDAKDYADTPENGRSFARLDEALLGYRWDGQQFSIGRRVLFWGALEARHIVDGFNPQEQRNDPFVTDKIGAWSAAYAYYTQTGELSLIVKTHEENLPMAEAPYAYRLFPDTVSYDEAVVSESSRDRPTLYGLWSGTAEWEEWSADYALIVQSGYDSQRYFAPEGAVLPPVYHQYAYRANKIMTYDTLVAGAALFKLEALYADVTDSEVVSDYYHVGLGVEYTLEQVYDGASLGLIAEYYRYGTLQSGRLTDRDLFEVFQNDLFLGARWSNNDAYDTALIGGVVLDRQYGEANYYLEFERRLGDAYKLKADYRYIEPSDTKMTAYALLERHERVSVTLGYYF